jgi:hypothetical protein
MKFSAPLAKSLLMAASIGLVVPIMAQTPKPGRSEGRGKAGEEKPEVKGVERAWAGGVLGLAVESNAFVLRFYNEDKKPVPAAATRAAIRWDPVGKAGTERTVLNPSGDMELRSPTVVRPPHLFFAYATLLDEEGNATATVTFDLRELQPQEKS